MFYFCAFFFNWWNFAGQQGGLVTIYTRPGSTSHESITSNGIISQASGHSKRSFHFKSKFSKIFHSLLFCFNFRNCLNYKIKSAFRKRSMLKRGNRFGVVSEMNDCASNPCVNNGTCVNLITGYGCRCVNDYVGKSCDCELKDFHIYKLYTNFKANFRQTVSFFNSKIFNYSF